MGCCLRGETIRVTAGHQPRDFIYVDDVVSLLQIAGGRPDLRGQVLHAGAGRRQTVRDLVETIVSVAGRRRVEYGSHPARRDEPVVWQADLEATISQTGWAPVHDLRPGVERMWAWFRATANDPCRACA